MKKQQKIVQLVTLLILSVFLFTSCSAQTTVEKKENATNVSSNGYNQLTPEEANVILNKGTDRAFTGEYTDKFDEGVYQCRQCNTPLYVSDSKFHSTCGWPSFDQEIKGAVTKVKDADGFRTEIICSNCKGHLGHVFYGEKLTEKDTRHCVNTTSLIFVPVKTKGTTETAIFAGGCFWGVEYYFQNETGVISTKVGYTGGHLKNPSYKDVLSHQSGHYEALEVTFDPTKTDYETLAKLFFEIHDPTQANGQGNDIGQQYQSVVFYVDDEQKAIASSLIQQLKDKGFKVATQLKLATKFWIAEEYHQAYYEKEEGTPYCHKRVKRF
jgi:peptide methionine sulfoxide reductase msrA/msrB